LFDFWRGVVRGRFLFALLFSLLVSSEALACERLNIISFDEEIIEVKKDGRHGKVVDMAIVDIGAVPLPVLSTDKMNFHKIMDEGGKELWISGSYVTVDNKKVKPNCRSVIVSRASDNKAFGVRGAGETCKRK